MASESEVIRHQMEGTRRDLADKIDQLEAKVAGTVESVSETVGNVRETVEETVEAVEHTFDLNWHAQRHPWMLLGGAVLVGFLGGAMLRSRRRERVTHHWTALPPPTPALPPPPKKEEHKEAPGGGILDSLSQEASELKKYGIGMAMGVMREVVANALPTVIAPAVSEAVNHLTVRLGGQPIEASQPDQATQQPSSQAASRPEEKHSELGCGL